MRPRFLLALLVVAFAGIADATPPLGLLLEIPAADPVFSSSDVITAKGAPVRAAEWTSIGTSSLTTTAAFPWSSEVSATAADFAAGSTLTQSIRIVNKHATNFICVKPFAFVTSCADTCAASGLTCSGASTDGDPVGPGVAYTIAFTAEVCPCWIASAASTTAGATRIARRPL